MASLSNPQHSANKFSSHVWQRSLPIYEAILAMPFNVRVMEGTLSNDLFKGYIEQDEHYICYYVQAASVALSKCSDKKHIEVFMSLVKLCESGEESLHFNYLTGLYGMSREEWKEQTRPSPTCHHYGSFLVATAYRESLPMGKAYPALHKAYQALHKAYPAPNKAYPALNKTYQVLNKVHSPIIVAASILPCAWLYYEVACYMKSKPSVPGNPYQPWIDYYAKPESAAFVGKFVEMLDELAEKASDEERQKMSDAFVKGMQLEWMFWDAAWREEKWPF